MRSWHRWLGLAWWSALAFWSLIILASLVIQMVPSREPSFVTLSVGLTWIILLGLGLLWVHSGPRFKAWLGFDGLVLIAWLNWRALPLIAMLCGAYTVIKRRAYAPGSVEIGRRWGIWPITLSIRDRFLHLHVLGPTGSGKSSSMLLPMMVQDLASGHPVALIEPKGDLSQAAHQHALKHAHRVVYFDPEDPRCPHYNPLAGAPATAAEGISWALNQIAASGHPFYAVSSRVLLMYAVIAVKEALADRADLDAVLRFLRRDGERDAILAAVSDPRVTQYFSDQVKKLNPRQALEQRQGLLNRLELLLLHPDIRRVLSPPYDFDWDQALAQRMSVFCPLSLARLGDSARILGTLLWHGLAMATYRRPLSSDLTPYFLYLDEFHEYVTPDLSEFLALARGYHVGLVLAHQDLGQLSHELREAIMANGRQKVVLGGAAPADFEIFKDAALPYPIDPQLRFFGPGHAWVQLVKDGKPRPPHPVTLRHQPLGVSQ